MKFRYGHLMVALLLSAGSASAVNNNNDPDNPFFYAPEKKPDAVGAVAAPIIIQNPELSDQQRETVKNMLTEALTKISPEFARKETNAAILTDNEVYVGITSGMHLIYNEQTQKFRYIDSKKHKEVLTKSAFDKRVKLTESHINKVVQEVVDGPSTKTNLLSPGAETPAQNAIQPIKLKGN